MILVMAPKDVYNSSLEIGTAIHLGVPQFNRGYQCTYSELLPTLDLNVYPKAPKAWQSIEQNRLYLAEYSTLHSVKKWRKQKRKNEQKLQREDTFVHQEGTTCKSQSFHGGGATKKKAAGGSKKETSKGGEVDFAQYKTIIMLKGY